MDADDVLAKIKPRVGSEALAYAWYFSEPLLGFGGNTAMQMVEASNAQQVINYIPDYPRKEAMAEPHL